MNDSKIQAKLAGPEDARNRRADVLAELSTAFAEGGEQAATDSMTRRMAALTTAFTDRLRDLKKQL